VYDAKGSGCGGGGKTEKRNYTITTIEEKSVAQGIQGGAERQMFVLFLGVSLQTESGRAEVCAEIPS